MPIVCCNYSEMQLSFKIMYLEFVSNILSLGFVIQFWNKLPFFGFQLLCLRVLQIGVKWKSMKRLCQFSQSGGGLGGKVKERHCGGAEAQVGF